MYTLQSVLSSLSLLKLRPACAKFCLPLWDPSDQVVLVCLNIFLFLRKWKPMIHSRGGMLPLDLRRVFPNISWQALIYTFELPYCISLGKFLRRKVAKGLNCPSTFCGSIECCTWLDNALTRHGTNGLSVLLGSHRLFAHRFNTTATTTTLY